MLLYVHRDPMDYQGRGAQVGHLDFHTAAKLWFCTISARLFIKEADTWADTRKLKIPLFKKKYSGQRSFSYQGPVTWNNLPFSIRHTQTYSSFKSQLQTFQ